MQSLKPSLPISSSLKNNPVLESDDLVFGKTGDAITGQSNLLPDVSNSTSTANALDAVLTYLEEGNTNFTLGVLCVTTSQLPFAGLVYDNGENDDGVGATLTSTDNTILGSISGHNLAIHNRILITTAGLNGIPITDLRNNMLVTSNNICNGIYNVVSTTPIFQIKRAIDSDFASYFNNTSVIVLKGTEAGKLYSLQFNSAKGLDPFLVGYDELIFEELNLGSTANPSAGVNSVNTVTTTALPSYNYDNTNKTITASPAVIMPLINGFTIGQFQRILVNNETDQRVNGVYYLSSPSVSAPFVLTRAEDFVAYNNTSISITNGTYAGSIAYVNYDATKALNPFILGTDPISFSIISSGSVGNPTNPPLGDGINNILNIAGINTTDTIADGFDKTIMALDHLANKVEPLPLFSQYVLGDVSQNKPKLYDPLVVNDKLFTMPDQSYTVILNNNIAAIETDNTYEVVSGDAYIGATNLQFQLNNMLKTGPFNVNVENISNYADLSRYPSIGPVVRDSISGSITVGYTVDGGNTLSAQTINLDDSIITVKNGFNTFDSNKIRILEMGHMNDYYNSVTNQFSKTRSIAFDFNFGGATLFQELGNGVKATPGVNDNFVSFTFNTGPLTIQSRFFNYTGIRRDPEITNVSVLPTPATNDLYISGVPRMNFDTELPITFTLENVIDKYLIPGPETVKINDLLQKLNKLNYKVPSSAKYNLAGYGNDRKDISTGLSTYEEFPEKELQISIGEATTLMKSLKVNYGHIFECYFDNPELFTNDIFLNTDILANADAHPNNILSGGKAIDELWTYPADLIVGNPLGLSSGTYKLKTQIVPASVGKDFFYLPGTVNVKCKTRRWDNAYYPNGNLNDNFTNFPLSILVDTVSFKNSIFNILDNGNGFTYEALIISEKDSSNVNILRVAGSGDTIDDIPTTSLTGVTFTPVLYDSTVSINSSGSTLPYSRDLLFMDGKYQYPRVNYTAVYPHTTNNCNFTVPVFEYRRYATFLVKCNNPSDNTYCLKNVSSLIIEIINYDSDNQTRNSTGLFGDNGIVTNPGFDMYIMFVSAPSHTCERRKGMTPFPASETSVWINANKFYDGTINNCVDDSFNNTADKKRLTFGLNRFSGDLLVRIGMSQYTNCIFSGISVTSFA